MVDQGTSCISDINKREKRKKERSLKDRPKKGPERVLIGDNETVATKEGNKVDID